MLIIIINKCDICIVSRIIWRKRITLSLTLFRMREWVAKGPPSSLSPVTSTNVVSSQKFWLLAFTLLPHWYKISRLYLQYFTWILVLLIFQYPVTFGCSCLQCCLQVSDTVSWHKLYCCCSSNIL